MPRSQEANIGFLFLFLNNEFNGFHSIGKLFNRFHAIGHLYLINR